MVKRPLFINLIALFMASIPVFGLSLIYSNNLDVIQISKTLPELVVLAAACLATAFGVWRVRKWGYYTFFAFVTIVVVMDSFQAIRSGNFTNPWYFVDAAFIAMGIYLFRRREIYEPYFNPQIRWWERASRYSVDLTAQFELAGKSFSSQILDLSESGCFANVKAGYALGDKVKISAEVGGVLFSASGQVVRVSKNPEGIGFQFVYMGWADKRAIKRIIRHLKNLPKNPTAEKVPA